jgi:hypothetical protein
MAKVERGVEVKFAQRPASPRGSTVCGRWAIRCCPLKRFLKWGGCQNGRADAVQHVRHFAQHSPMLAPHVPFTQKLHLLRHLSFAHVAYSQWLWLKAF